VNVLKGNEVDIGTKILDDFDGGVDVEEDEVGKVEENDEVDPELEENGEEAFDAFQPKCKAIRSANYTELEDLHLVRACEVVSLNVVADSDQTGKKLAKN
jgi:hypothetical protein